MDQKLKILILDDDQEVGEVLGSLLEDQFDCEIFVDASLALQALRTKTYNFVISDMEMPNMNGIEFIKAARDIDDKFIIFISTGHDVYHPKIKAAFNAGAYDIISKPYLAIEQLIQRLLAAHQSLIVKN